MSETYEYLSNSDEKCTDRNAARINRVDEWRQHKQSRKRAQNDVEDRNVSLHVNAMFVTAEGAKSCLSP